MTEPPWAHEVRTGWSFLTHVRSTLHHALSGGLYGSPRPITLDFEALCYGLLLVQAYAVLECALQEIREDGLFTPERGGLERLMAASKGHLPWLNYPFVDKGRKYRNEVVHDGKPAAKVTVLGYVDAIQEELFAWASLKREEFR